MFPAAGCITPFNDLYTLFPGKQNNSWRTLGVLKENEHNVIRNCIRFSGSDMPATILQSETWTHISVGTRKPVGMWMGKGAALNPSPC